METLDIEISIWVFLLTRLQESGQMSDFAGYVKDTWSGRAIPVK